MSMQYDDWVTLPALLEGEDPEEVIKAFSQKTGCLDTIFIDRCLLSGMSPDEAAHKLFNDGTPVRTLEGLRYLARVRTLRLMEFLGPSEEDLLNAIRGGGKVMVSERWKRRLVLRMNAEGIRIKVGTVIHRSD